MRGTDSALTDKAGFSLSTAGILAVWHQAMSAVVTAGSVGKLLKDEITSARMAVLTDWIDAGRLDLLLDAILGDTGELQTDWTEGGRLDLLIDAILMDTGELQVDWVDGGRLDLLIDAIKLETDKLDAAHTEPTGVPAANESPLGKIAYLFMEARNKVTATATKKTVFGDDGVAEYEYDLSDAAGTYTESEANII